MQVFDAGEGKTISILIEEFNFDHVHNIYDASFNDRLAMLTSDLSGVDMTFKPVEIKWMQKTSVSVGDISGTESSNSQLYYQNVNGFVFPKNKLTAVHNYNGNADETEDAAKIFFDDKLSLISTNKRFVKFKFFSNVDTVASGWKIKVFTSLKDPIQVIESRVINQKGNLGNSDEDFNFKFNFNSDYYLEMDKSIKDTYTDISGFKDLAKDGLTLGFQRKKEFLIIKINDILWQFVIKIPPTGYVFDYVNENGTILGQLAPVSNVIIGPNNNNLKASNMGDSIGTTIKFDDTNISFDENGGSASLDSGRKYIVYIRKSTSAEKTYFDTFEQNRIVQFSSTEITTRMSDWYPFAVNYKNANNKYNYGVLFNTDEVILEDEIIETIQIIDACNLCRTVTKTQNMHNFKLRYASKVKSNFNLASRVRESC